MFLLYKFKNICYNLYKENGGILLMYIISDECIKCGACADGCPVSAISEGDDKYQISEDCIECGACVDTCPVGAISQE